MDGEVAEATKKNRGHQDAPAQPNAWNAAQETRLDRHYAVNQTNLVDAATCAQRDEHALVLES